MAFGQPIAQRTTILTAGASSQAGQSWFEATGYQQASFTVRVTQTATVSASLVLRATNNTPQDTNEAALAVSAITALPAGWSLTGGVLTIASTGSGTFSATLASALFPSFILPDYTYTSGGGTLAISVIASGW